ncbi:MAG: ferredoxin [Syntrophales bacterium]
MKKPVVELSDCTVCGVCVESCPEVFRLNESGYIEVIELKDYPEKKVNEAIKNCPADCIYWEKD